MNRTLIITVAAALLAATPAVAQDDLRRVLESVERNNLTLQAEAHATAGRTFEARTGNSLEPLSVSYSSAETLRRRSARRGNWRFHSRSTCPCSTPPEAG